MAFAEQRRKMGLTQVEVAQQLGVTGAAVSMWESGKTLPRLSLLPKIAALYGCTVDELLREQPKNSTQDVR